jgi:signal peptide peptidase-like protein 2B
MTGDMVLANRGNCTFTTKAREAQAAGAKALLVVNDAEGK